MLCYPWMFPEMSSVQTLVTITLAVTVKVNHASVGIGGPDDRSYCTKSGPCTLGQGDCDKDSECSENLVCGTDNCREFNTLAMDTTDCCTYPVGIGGPDDRSYCTKSGPCTLGQGDCDKDTECSENLVCGTDNCREFNTQAMETTDCCTYQEISGEVMSPNFPEPYPNNVDTPYTIMVEAGKLIEIHFTDFDIEFHSSCRYDYVRITDGNGKEILPRSCGSTKPDDVLSATNKVLVIFHSDSSMQKSGFKLTWTIHANIRKLTEVSHSKYIGSLIAIGGYNGRYISSAEVLNSQCDFPLPEGRFGHVSVTTADCKILVCGGITISGYTDSCIQFNLQSKTWEHHSSLKNISSQFRLYSTAIALKHGVYILGGMSQWSSQFLATGSNNWKQGPKITQSGVMRSCGVKLSDTEFVILGGTQDGTQARVCTTTKEKPTECNWSDWPRLSEPVYGQSCVSLGDRILMAGGIVSNKVSRRVVIFDIKNGSAVEKASLKYARAFAAMAIYDGKPVILGGREWMRSSGAYRNDGEMYDVQTNTWEEADISLKMLRNEFSLLPLAMSECEPEVCCKEGWHSLRGSCYKCQGGWHPFQGSCYKFFNDYNYQLLCRKDCKEEGGELASIHSMEENKFLEGFIKLRPALSKYSTERVTWIGGWLSEMTKEFSWYDRTPWDFSNWAKREPHKSSNGKSRCVMLGHKSENLGKWADGMCWWKDFKNDCVCKHCLVSCP